MNLAKKTVDRIEAMANECYVVSFSSKAVSICHTQKLFLSSDAVGFSMDFFDPCCLSKTLEESCLKNISEP
jgi:hypothetical protein